MKNQTLEKLLDDDLSPDELERILDQVLADPELQKSWHAQYTLRAVVQDDGIHAYCHIVDKVAAVIAEEPTIIAPENLSFKRTAESVPAANVVSINSKRTKVMAFAAIAASFAAIVMVSYSPEKITTSTIADTTTTMPNSLAAEQELQSMIVQHGEFSGAVALNGLVAYAKVVNGSTVSGVR
jgi:negative regulator of sigma E activity